MAFCMHHTPFEGMAFCMHHTPFEGMAFCMHHTPFEGMPNKSYFTAFFLYMHQNGINRNWKKDCYLEKWRRMQIEFKSLHGIYRPNT